MPKLEGAEARDRRATVTVQEGAEDHGRVKIQWHGMMHTPERVEEKAGRAEVMMDTPAEAKDRGRAKVSQEAKDLHLTRLLRRRYVRTTILIDGSMDGNQVPEVRQWQPHNLLPQARLLQHLPEVDTEKASIASVDTEKAPSLALRGHLKGVMNQVSSRACLRKRQINTKRAQSLVQRGQLVTVMTQDPGMEKLLSLVRRGHLKEAKKEEAIEVAGVEVQGQERASQGWLAMMFLRSEIPTWVPRVHTKTTGMAEIEAAGEALPELSSTDENEMTIALVAEAVDPEAGAVVHEAEVQFTEVKEIGARARGGIMVAKQEEMDEREDTKAQEEKKETKAGEERTHEKEKEVTKKRRRKTLAGMWRSLLKDR